MYDCGSPTSADGRCAGMRPGVVPTPFTTYSQSPSASCDRTTVQLWTAPISDGT